MDSTSTAVTASPQAASRRSAAKTAVRVAAARARERREPDALTKEVRESALLLGLVLGLVLAVVGVLTGLSSLDLLGG